MTVRRAVILVGGKATRLLPLTCNTPKAMVPILNTPFLEYAIGYLRQHGIDEVVLAQSHLPVPIRDYFGDGSRFGLRISYAIEETPLGTAGAVRNAERYLGSAGEDCLVLNGDIFSDINITDMIDFHLSRRAKVTIALTPVDDPTSYGLVETDAGSRVTRFLEKPSRDQITTNMINAGTYLLNAEILTHIPQDTSYSFERELFPSLLGRGEAVYAYPSRGYFVDIGTPAKYLGLHHDLLNGESSLWAPTAKTDVGQHSCIHPSVRINRTKGAVLIGDNCSIAADVQLTGPVAIGAGSTIAEGAVLEESVLWQNVRVGPRAIIRKSVVANDSTLNAGCIIEDSLLSDHVTVRQGARIEPGSRIWSGETAG
ncbi:MAG: NDP-sugar synthase [Chloroflexi bacterium]|nr:NDP-sugar synthase [Chloroflexota bacterium]